MDYKQLAVWSRMLLSTAGTVEGKGACSVVHTACAPSAPTAWPSMPLSLDIQTIVIAPAASSKERSLVLAERFESPIKEAVRSVRSVQAVCADRAAALGAVSAAKVDLDAKKVWGAWGARAGVWGAWSARAWALCVLFCCWQAASGECIAGVC